MNTKRVKTKSEMIADRLRQEIISDKFSKGQLPSKLELAAHFGVSHRTMETALKRLMEEGLIRGVRGTGIFINQDVQDVHNLTNRLVLMLMPACSIFEDEPYNTLRHVAFSRGLLPINLPMPDRYVKLSLLEKTTMNQILRAPIRGVIYNGRGYRAEPFLDNWRNLRSVALRDFDSEFDPPGSSVLIDNEAGAEKLAKHFIEKGCRRLAVLASYIAPDVSKSEQYWKKHISTQFMNGVSRAAKEAGLPAPELHFMQEPPKDQEELLPATKAALSDLISRYDGILCTVDHVAYTLIQFAISHGVRVPEDLLVSAEGDTPWCSRFGINITTMSLMADQLCTRAFEILEEGGIHHEKIVPDIIFRQSTNR